MKVINCIANLVSVCTLHSLFSVNRFCDHGFLLSRNMFCASRMYSNISSSYPYALSCPPLKAAVVCWASPVSSTILFSLGVVTMLGNLYTMLASKDT